jgi:two-component system, sensor histidine kinase and response regulator
MATILIIEDERSMREALVMMLNQHAFVVHQAENGSQGIELAHRVKPDLILCDVMMPGMDGYEVLKSLRQHSSTQTIPLIFLTAQTDRAKMRQGMDLGADDYLTKPCSELELLRAIICRLDLRAANQRRLAELRSCITLSLPHEMRTPLNGILGFAELLREHPLAMDPQEVQEIAGEIYHAADRLSQMIQKFLYYAELELMRQDSDQLEWLITCQTQAPQELLWDIAQALAHQTNRQADLEIQLDPISVQMGEREFSMLLREVIENAFKFSKPGQPVVIQASPTPTYWQIEITNKGRGMSPEQISQLGAYMQFDRRFYEQQGVGLGLAIAQRILQLHQGYWQIQSQPDHITQVQLYIPRAQQHEY